MRSVEAQLLRVSEDSQRGPAVGGAPDATECRLEQTSTRR